MKGHCLLGDKEISRSVTRLSVLRVIEGNLHAIIIKDDLFDKQLYELPG